MLICNTIGHGLGAGQALCAVSSYEVLHVDKRRQKQRNNQGRLETLGLYQVCLQVEGAQQLETLEAGHADDPVGGQVEDLQTLLIVQPFNLLQLVPLLRGRAERATHTKRLTFIKKKNAASDVQS